MPPVRSSSRSSASGSAASALFSATMVGMSRKPRSSRMRFTASRRVSAPGLAASTTCSRTSASPISSSVLRKARVRSFGRSRMKPTVSVRTTGPMPSRYPWRLVGRRVANSLFSARTRRGSSAACVNAFSSVLFPAFVYPTMLITGTALRSRPLRRSSRRCATPSSCFSRKLRRSLMRRRSNSSFVSPGPRVPIAPPPALPPPPPMRDRAAPAPSRRGFM